MTMHSNLRIEWSFWDRFHTKMSARPAEVSAEADLPGSLPYRHL